MGWDVDAFLADCLAARAETEPRRAIKEVLAKAMGEPAAALAAALPTDRARLHPLHVSPELTVLHVVWAPGMTFGPHDHRMWAAIGIYSGGEDNAFYRRTTEGITSSGGTTLRPGDVTLLGDDTIHAVTNPTAEHAGAIHIYGGDLIAAERSEFDPTTGEVRPYDSAATARYFDAQNS